MNTPEHLTDAEINELVEHGTMPAPRASRDEIDLGALDVAYSVCPCAAHDCRFEARDRKSFDDEPGATWHLVGTGPHKRAALNDLLRQMKEARSFARLAFA